MATTPTPAPTTTAPAERQLARAGFSARRMLDVSARIVRQFLRDRRSLALLFVAPLLVLTILNFVLNGTSTSATLGIAADPSVISLIQSNAHAPGNVAIKRVDPANVDAALKDGTVDGVIVLPADFARQLAAGQTPNLELRLDGTDPAKAKLLAAVVPLLVGSLASAAPGAPPGTRVAPTLTTTYLYGNYTQTDALAPLLVGLFAFFFVFLLTSVSFLRERSQGTIERLMVSPLSRTELVLGYVCGFLLFAAIQSLLILLFVIYVLQVHYRGNLALLFLVTLALTVGGVNMGIFASAFARNELQVVQFIPLLLVPQILLGGLFFPVATLPPVLKQIAMVLPVTYANYALKDVMLKGFGLGDIWPDLAALVAFAALMVVGAAVSLRGDRM
ncbi:MAG TPA: ABC transporter permease [Ktedonobacterales bacterium]|jgi:ABC-2 type transport system permease protein